MCGCEQGQCGSLGREQFSLKNLRQRTPGRAVVPSLERLSERERALYLHVFGSPYSGRVEDRNMKSLIRDANAWRYGGLCGDRRRGDRG